MRRKAKSEKNKKQGRAAVFILAAGDGCEASRALIAPDNRRPTCALLDATLLAHHHPTSPKKPRPCAREAERPPPVTIRSRKYAGSHSTRPAHLCVGRNEGWPEKGSTAAPGSQKSEGRVEKRPETAPPHVPT